MNARMVSAALLAGALLMGCSSEAEEPKGLPPVPTAASPTSEPSAVAVPSEAQAATPEGAAEFARFWFDTLNAAAQTGDTTSLRAISAPGCKACEAFATSIENLYGPGGRIEGGVFTVKAAEAPALGPEATAARVTVVYDVSPTKQLGADGEELSSTPALTAVDGDMRLVRIDGAWRAAELVTS